MNGRIVKKIRKKYKSGDVLLQVVKECGDRTKEMNKRQLYRKVKKLYKQGRVKI